MNLSINPTYFCNLRCSFCYLGDKLGDRTALDLGVLDNRLREIVAANRRIDYVDLYGGEVTLLPEDYLDEMFNIIHRYYSGNINVVTNLTKIHPILLRDDVDISVSFDFECRTGYKRTLQNISLLPPEKPVALLMLASDCLMKLNVPQMISVLNGLRNVQSVEIKPYSTNQYNQDSVQFVEFEEFVKQFLTNPEPLRAEFVNRLVLDEAVSGKRNAFSDQHVYITPSGKFGVLDFDHNDNEYFNELASIEDYFRWAKIEKIRVTSNPFCSQCKYLGRCLTEHYRDVKTLKNSCNGFITLLKWYDERLQSPAKDLPRQCVDHRP